VNKAAIDRGNNVSCLFIVWFNWLMLATILLIVVTTTLHTNNCNISTEAYGSWRHLYSVCC
jgi:hypothetical protein